MRFFFVALLALGLAGCAALPGGGSAPYNLTSGILPSVDCNGSGTITFNGGTGAIGGAAGATWKCDPGAFIHQVQPGGFNLTAPAAPSVPLK